MTRSLNRVQLIGNLGQAPELKQTSAGQPIVTFSVALHRAGRTPEGETREETEWVRVVAWDRLGAICHQFLHKGSRVYLEGRLQTRSWQDQSGQDHAQTTVVASEMILLDSRPATAEPVAESEEDDEPLF